MNLPFQKEKDEETIQRLFVKNHLKRPPAALMQNFSAEVREKIECSAAKSLFGSWVIPSFAFAAVLAGCLLIFVWYQANAKQVPVEQPAVLSTAEKPEIVSKAKPQVVPPAVLESNAVENSNIPASHDPLVEKMSQNLFVLEVLGETEGIDQKLSGAGDADMVEQMANVF